MAGSSPRATTHSTWTMTARLWIWSPTCSRWTASSVRSSKPRSPFVSHQGLRGRSLALLRSELTFGSDLNGDGDMLDVVPALYYFRSGNLRQPAGGFTLGALGCVRESAPPSRRRSGPGWPGLEQRRRCHGSRDARALERAPSQYASRGSGPTSPSLLRGAERSSWSTKAQNGGVDLNGDGDALDQVVHLLQLCP